MPKYIVADAGYGSEQNYEDILSNRKCEALIPYTMYEKEQKKKYKQNPFHPDNRTYDEESDTYMCPNQQRVTFRYRSVRTDKTGLQTRIENL